jgi:hypothetical protein
MKVLLLLYRLTPFVCFRVQCFPAITFSTGSEKSFYRPSLFRNEMTPLETISEKQRQDETRKV